MTKNEYLTVDKKLYDDMYNQFLAAMKEATLYKNALIAAKVSFDRLSTLAYENGLEGTKEWDAVAGGADIYNVCDLIRQILKGTAA